MQTPSGLTSAIAANFLGTGWSAGISILFTPAYIYFIGIESYGLIGLYAVGQALFAVADLGLAGTVNREMARISANSHDSDEARILLRTSEWVYWSVAIFIGITISILSPIVANKWLEGISLSPHEIENAVIMLGWALACRWPFNLYAGAMMGLQHHIWFNCARVASETIRAIGSIFVLWAVSPTVMAFFTWQALVGLISTCVIARGVWGGLPGRGRIANFDIAVIKRIWKLSLGISGGSVTAALFMQTDKIVLSKILTLEAFGYYALASTVAMTILLASSPMFATFYPRLTMLVAAGHDEALKRAYHLGSQVFSVIVLPISITIAFFSMEIMEMWTRNQVLALQTNTLVSTLVGGTTVIALTNIPYALQLAHGWTKLAIVMNGVAVIMTALLVWSLTSLYGVQGAAFGWLGVSCLYAYACIQMTHRKFLPGEHATWLFQDIGRPFVSSLIIIAGGRLLLDASISSTPARIASIFLLLSISIITSVLMSKELGPVLRYRLDKIAHVRRCFMNVK